MNSTFFKIVGICLLVLNSVHLGHTTVEIGKKCRFRTSMDDEYCLCPGGKAGPGVECQNGEWCNAYTVTGHKHGSGFYKAKCESSAISDTKKIYRESGIRRNLLSSKVKKDDENLIV